MTFLSYDIYFEMRLCFVCLLCTNFAFWTSAESGYSIKLKQGKRESYLWMEFPLVNESIFPRNLKLNLSVDNYAGLLLYSIDANKNQLVVDMSGKAMNLLVKVMGRKEEQISLKRLCGCEQSMFIHLLLEMGMRNSTFWVKCNGGSESVVSFNWSNRTLAEGYPKLKHKQGNRSSSANFADLYFIDYPNNTDSHQMQGCIFDIEYNGQSIINNISMVGKGITKGCRKTCSSEICNGGVCLDTYVKEPICNCTTAFGSGKNCTDVSSMVNRRYTKTFNKFIGIKLSWRSSGTILWEMGNNIRQLTVSVTVDYSQRLVLILTDSQRNHVGEETLLTDYVRNESYVLILRPYKTIPHKKVNNVTVIYANYSALKDEDVNIDYMILSSCDGVMDVAVLEKEDGIQWNRLELKEKDSSPHNCSHTKQSGDRNPWIYTAIGTVSSVIFAIIIGCVLYKRRIKRTYMLHAGQKKNKEKDSILPSYWQNDSMYDKEVREKSQRQSTNIEMDVRKRQSYATTNNGGDNLIRCAQLRTAAGKGYLKEVKSLMKEGADVKAVDDNGRTPLHYAAINGHLKVVEHLLNNHANINATDANKRTALHLAVENNKSEVLECLVSVCDKIDAQDDNMQTALHLAAKNGNENVVIFLTLNGSNVNIEDANNQTPLHFAANAGCLNVVTHLIGKGAKVNAVENNNSTPLHFAARNGHLDVVKYLNENGTSVDVVNKNEGTALHLAARNGHLDVVKYLTYSKADAKMLNNNNETALHLAARNGHLEIVKHLNKKDTGVDDVNKYNETALHLAARNDHLQVVEHLVDLGAKVDALDEQTRTPFHLAARSGYLEVMICLEKKILDIHKAAYINAKDGNSRTPLHYAAENNHLKVAEYLVDLGAKVDAVDDNNQTALHLAVENNKLEVLKYLVEAHASINAQDKKMQTALHLAAKNGNAIVVKFLTVNGANINIEDANKQRPLDHASRNGYVAVVEYLRKKGAEVNAADKNSRTLLHYAANIFRIFKHP